MSVPLSAFGRLSGVEELKFLISVAEPTDSPTIRRIYVSAPQDMLEFIRNQQAVNLAAREFITIADPASLDGERLEASLGDLDGPVGIKAGLASGGTIRLRVRNPSKLGEKPSAEIHVTKHGIAEYEKVKQIEFVFR
jgi:hypothetical protein